MIYSAYAPAAQIDGDAEKTPGNQQLASQCNGRQSCAGRLPRSNKKLTY